MRVLLACLTGLMAIAPAFAQPRSVTRPAAASTETRYFASIDGLMSGNADTILKETRQGTTVKSAVLDVCYPAGPHSERKDRFVADLAIDGDTMTGTAQSMVDKLPVSVKLVRKPKRDRVEFRGEITIGQTTTRIDSVDNTDLSAQEFLESQIVDDDVVVAPKDFTEVSPESLGIRVRLDNAVEFLKQMKGQDIAISLDSLVASCHALRSGGLTVKVSLDPDRTAAFLAKVKKLPGVVKAGWTSGAIDMERTTRFAADGWRAGDRIDRDKIAAMIASVSATTLSAKLVSSRWNDRNGRLTLTLKRPSDTFPELGLTETLEVEALVSPDRPGPTDKLMLWIGVPATVTTDASSGPRLNLIDASDDEDDIGDPSDDSGLVAALATKFGGQRWDLENSAWK